MDIYNPYVTSSTATFDLIPRSLETQREWIEDRSGARFVLVAETEDGEVCGFASISQFRDRAAYATTVEDSVYIAPESHGIGVGKALLSALIETARAHGFHSMIARIESEQKASIALHHACGFKVVGHENEVGRKFGRWLDVIVMQRRL